MRARDLLAAIAPSALAALAMAVAVHFASPYVADQPPPVHLAILVALGAAIYFALLWRFARPMLNELVTFVTRKQLTID